MHAYGVIWYVSSSPYENSRKYLFCPLFTCEMRFAREEANFISHCDEGAIFHNFRKEIISHFSLLNKIFWSQTNLILYHKILRILFKSTLSIEYFLQKPIANFCKKVYNVLTTEQRELVYRLRGRCDLRPRT